MNKHLILTNGRSGSNYLVTLLNSHPQITNYGEVLGNWTLPYKINNNIRFGNPWFNDYQNYLDYIYSSQFFFYSSQLYSVYARIKKRQSTNFKLYSKIKSIGIKDFSINFDRRKITNYLQNNEDILIINLYRKNSLKRLVSLQAMHNTGVIASTKQDKNQNLKIYLSPEQIIHQMQTFEQEKKEQFAMIESIPESRLMNISYEEYFADTKLQNNINQEILNFLKVDNINLEGKHKKILSSSLADLLENYDEIYEILSDTEYAKYLNT